MAKPSIPSLARITAANIRRLRARRHLTQEDAAHRSGIDYKRWQQIEAGRVNLTFRTVERIARALKVSPLLFFMA